ncbi:MAG TPA: EAL domain-containing protein [Burkholderiales bacterium]|nr:EAL domain-containing protein [Burkholderiales bacterium]
MTAALVTALVVVWSALAYQLSSIREDRLSYARQEGDNLSQLVAEHFSSYTATIDVWLQHLRSEWLRDPRNFPAAAALEKAALGGDTAVMQTSIVDAKGWLAFSDLPGAQSGLLADRPYFKVHASGGGRDALYISDPVRGRATGRLGIQFTRPILAPSGDFRGVVVISISPQQLIRVYQGLSLGSDAFIALRRTSGEVLARSRDYEKLLDRVMPSVPEELRHLPSGSFARTGLVDGVQRLFSFRNIPERDLTVVISRGRDEVLAPYYQQRRFYVGAGGLVSAGLLLLFLIAHVQLRRDFRAQAAAEAALREHGERLAGVMALQDELGDEKLDVGAMCQRVVEKTRELVGTGAATIQFIDGDDFVYSAATQAAKHLVGSRTPLKGNFSAAILESGQAILCDDTQTDPRINADAAMRAGARSLIGAPLHHEGRVIGVLKLISGVPGSFRAEQLSTLELLAGIAGSAIQRKRAQDELRQSEARFRSLTDLSSDVYWEQDENFRFTSFTEHRPGEVVLPRTHMVGKRRWDQHYVNMTPADWARHIALMQSHQDFHELELCRIEEGREVWINTSGQAVFDAQGTFKGYRGVGKDITERKREEALLRLEHTVTQRLGKAESERAAIEDVLHELCKTEGWECGRYFRLDERAEVLRFAGAWGTQDEEIQRYIAASKGVTYARGQGLIGQVCDRGEPLWVSDDGTHTGVARPAFGVTRDVFLFPLRTEEKTFGVLSFMSRASRTPDQRLLQAVRVIGSQVGQFLQRKRGEQAMRESEGRFRSLTQLSSDWYWEQDANFRFIKFEGRGAGEGGFSSATVIGKCAWELPGIELDAAQWDALRADLAGHESFRNFEYSYRDRLGERHYISVDGEAVFDEEGAFTGYRGTSRDVTRQRRGEEELRRFRAAMDMSPDAIYLTDRATLRFLDVNEAACRGTGYTRAQLLEMGPEALLLRPRPALEKDYDEVIAAGDAGLVTETSFSGRAGHQGWTELHRRALRAGEGWIIVTISRDITERKRAEERQVRHLRLQERIARFGQSAIAKRDAAELIQDAVRTILEGLRADGVAYIERVAGDVVLRVVEGVQGWQGDEASLGSAGTALAELLQPDCSRLVVRGADLGLPWAAAFKSAALIPLHSEGSVRGALCLFGRQAGAFASEEFNFVDAVAGVLSTALQRADSEGKLAFLAQFDTLTGLPNRALLRDRFSQMIVHARRHARQLGVLFVDLDEFKLVNDSLGHAAGDALLKEVASRLQSAVRAGDTVARIAGDEFAVVLADLAKAEDAALVAQKIIEKLAASVQLGGHEMFVTASVGVAVFPSDGEDAEDLLNAADAAMYKAKQAGRNSYQFFTSEITQRTRARAVLGTELRRALEREEFTLYYQPKYDLRTSQPCAAEALLRWNHPQRGLVSPAEFIPVLEETGLIVAAGEWVVERACADLKALEASGIAPVPVAVNLSARQFRQANLAARIKSIVSSAGVEPALLELEITESQLMQDPQHAITMMRQLADAGMSIAIDDFGTGYSSLAYLTRFPLSSLKIDRSFVAGVMTRKGDAAVVRAILDMAHTLGFTVVAEGVETEAQAEFLRKLNCEQAQGFLFARPMPFAQLSALIQAAQAAEPPRRRPARKGARA